jgi:hypothetical protein
MKYILGATTGDIIGSIAEAFSLKYKKQILLPYYGGII